MQLPSHKIFKVAAMQRLQLLRASKLRDLARSTWKFRVFSQSAVSFAEAPKASSPVQSRPRPRRKDDKLPVVPLVAIFCLGSVSFLLLVKSREGQGKGFVVPEKAPASKQDWPRQTASDQTVSRR